MLEAWRNEPAIDAAVRTPCRHGGPPKTDRPLARPIGYFARAVFRARCSAVK